MGRRRGSIRNMNKDSKISIHVFVIWWTLFVLQAELVDSLHCSTYQSHVSIRPVCKSNLTQQSSASSGRLFKVLHTRDIIIQETLLLLLLLPASSYSTPSPPPILPILLLSSPPPPLALLPSSSSPPTPRQFLLLSSPGLSHTWHFTFCHVTSHLGGSGQVWGGKTSTNVRLEDVRPDWANVFVYVKFTSNQLHLHCHRSGPDSPSVSASAQCLWAGPERIRSQLPLKACEPLASVRSHLGGQASVCLLLSGVSLFPWLFLFTFQ